LAGPLNEGGGPAQDSQGEHSKAAGKQKQQLNAITPPVLNVQLDINNAKFEEWMKMATDNVCLLFMLCCISAHLFPDTENQRPELMELCPHRLLS
jgi:hypothetical protein